MARGSERDTLLRLQRNVVCLVVCLTFGVVFSKPGIEVMNSAYDIITSSIFSNSQNSKNLTDDGDEPEKSKVFHTLENKDPQEHTDDCLYGEFKTTDGDCVCYEQGTNFIGQTFARADDMETYQECQKLCQSQINCEYWSHYSGDERSNTCLLKNRISAMSRASDDPDSVYFVSGTKNCNVPITKDVRYDPSRVVSKNKKSLDEANPKKQISEEKRLHNVIAEHCLPKLVCELHRKSMEEFESFSESEKNLISLIGATTISGTPSKYHFAAHFGQLIRGIESQSCMNFYPQCPFSETDVRSIARKIAKTK